MLAWKQGRGIIVIAIVSIVIVGGTLIFWGSRDRPTNEPDADISLEETPEHASFEQVSNSIRQLSETTNQRAEAIKSVNDLAEVEDEDRGMIGMIVVNRLVGEGKDSEADSFVDYIMQRDDGYALEAARVCWQIADSQARRDTCLQRMTELARAQGIIDPSDSLPPSYYEQSDGES